ncbi:hypothetical protein [Streptomyces sp. RKAG337]|uniref:hypothetical protein n=1 Tax=Streptomyces sp. RKAG337 TaxID=2893404 RepID=UPI002034A19A|nr:hypothetical protein [Streptomyces sp. RKAG337]MCM2428728.1 hypothetical protein [Streptomyces sp. RKAG337]
MDPLSSALFPVVAVLFVVATALWVHQDASAHCGRGTPVYFSAGRIEVSTPAAWALGCLFLWIIFTPLYITCRRQAD